MENYSAAHNKKKEIRTMYYNKTEWKKVKIQRYKLPRCDKL